MTNTTPTRTPKEIGLSNIDLKHKWRKEGFGNVMEADFTVMNQNSFAIKDLEITCRHFSKSGTEIDRNTRVVYDIVNAYSTKKIMSFNMGFIHSQAAKSGCSVTEKFRSISGHEVTILSRTNAASLIALGETGGKPGEAGDRRNVPGRVT